MKIRVVFKVIWFLFAGLLVIDEAAAVASLPYIEEIVGEIRARANFVQDVLGISEGKKSNPAVGTFQVLSESDRIKKFDEICGAGKVFECGKFEQKSLEDLKKKHPRETSAQQGSFHVIVGEKPLSNPLVLQQVDSGSLQAVWGKVCFDNKKCLTVMVASNYNCLETTTPEDIPGDVTRYIYDRTQGPAASISAAPGLLLRHYFIKPEGKQFDLGLGHPQICLLDGILSKFQEANPTILKVEVQNGYLKLPQAGEGLKKLVDFFEKNSDLIKIGVHTNISASHGFADINNEVHCFLDNKENRPLINQVFCAALNMGPYAGGHKKTEENKTIAKILLQKQIEATIYAAWENNTDILLLALLGCGVFGNDPEWFVEGLEKCKDIIKQSGMRVVLNLFDRDGKHEKLEKLVNDTDGSYLKYRQHENQLFCQNIVRKGFPDAKVTLDPRSFGFADEAGKWVADKKAKEEAEKQEKAKKESAKFTKALTKGEIEEIFENKKGEVLGSLNFIFSKGKRGLLSSFDDYHCGKLSKDKITLELANGVIQACGVVEGALFKDFEPGIRSIVNHYTASSASKDSGFGKFLSDALEVIKKAERGWKDDLPEMEENPLSLALSSLQASVEKLKDKLGEMNRVLGQLSKKLVKEQDGKGATSCIIQ